MTCRAVLSIGANIGDSVARLRSVVSAAQADRILTAVSSVYATAPWGGVEQEDFRNAVLLVDWPGTPLELLAWCRARRRPPTGPVRSVGGRAPSTSTW